MANAGPNTNGSQFFICHQDLRGKLPKNYNRFGQVLSGNGRDRRHRRGTPKQGTTSRNRRSPCSPVTIEEA